MPPSRSKSAKPGALRLPGTFDSSPSPAPSNSPRRAATARAPPSASAASSTASRKLPGTTSIPASRLARPSPSKGSETASTGSTGLLSSFGSDAADGGSGRLDRAKSTPKPSSDSGPSRLERLGLNRASLRQRTASPSPEPSRSDDEDEDEEEEHHRRTRPKPSWGRTSSEDDDGPRPNYPTSTRSFSPAPTSSPPPPPRHRRSPKPPSLPSSPVAASAIPPVRPAEEENKPAEEAKGTLFGSLWTKAATAWNGGAPIETNVGKPGETEPTAAQPKEDPFRKTKRPPESAESPSSPKSHETPSVPLTSQHARTRSLPEPRQEPVEPITYHRPPEVHPRNVLLASTSSKFVHKDGYDWLGDEAKSPLDAYLFHRQASRMATKKVRVKRRPPQGMATASAILAGTAAAGAAAPHYGHPASSYVASATAGPTHPSLQPPYSSEASPGVFVSHPSPGPVHAFSQAPRQPAIAAPSNTPHPGPPPIPPPVPPGYRPSNSSSVTSMSMPVAAGTVATATHSYPQNPTPPATNPNALPAFPAPAPASWSSAGGSTVAQSRSQPPSLPPVQPQAQPRAFVPPVPPAYSAAPAPTAYPLATTSAPRLGPAPVFTAPAVGPPTSIKTEAPLGDMFKTALAKKMFGTQLSDAPRPTAAAPLGGLPVSGMALGGVPVVQYPPLVVLPQALVQGPSQPTTQPRLPTPAAPSPAPESQPASSSPPALDGSNPRAPLDHGVLPPMPIPQSITPPPPATATRSISFAPQRPSSRLGGWILPPPSSPFLGPSSSPAPSSDGDGGIDTPALSPTPVPNGTGADPGVENEVPEAQKEVDVAKSPRSSSTPILSASPAPIDAANEAFDTSTKSFLSLPTFAALATPLPPSPAPSRMSSIAASPSTSPAPTATQTSPLPVSPTNPPPAEDGEELPDYATAKSLPPSPSVSPALPPLPPSTDFSSLVSPPPPSKSPVLPPLPPSSPTPIVPPRPVSAIPPVVVPSSPPSLSLERTPSLAISLDSIPSPESINAANLAATSIMLQPPTPIEPEPTTRDDNNPSTHLLAAAKEDDATTISTSMSTRSVVTPLVVPLLELDLPEFESEFDFDALDFATPSIVPDLPDPQTYFGSLGLDFGGGGGAETRDGGQGRDAGLGMRGHVERDGEGRLELPVLREENLLASEEVEYVDDLEDDMSEQFDAATSFVSGFRETDLARAKVDPGHTGRTEKWLRGQGVRVEDGVETLRRGTEPTVNAAVAPNPSESSSTIFRPRTAPPSSIPPSSIPPSRSVYARSHRNLLSSGSTNYSTGLAATVDEEEEGAPPSPVRTMINFDQPLSSLDRGRGISSATLTNGTTAKKTAEDEERRRTALRALSNSAFSA